MKIVYIDSQGLINTHYSPSLDVVLPVYHNIVAVFDNWNNLVKASYLNLSDIERTLYPAVGESFNLLREFKLLEAPKRNLRQYVNPFTFGLNHLYNSANAPFAAYVESMDDVQGFSTVVTLNVPLNAALQGIVNIMMPPNQPEMMRIGCRLKFKVENENDESMAFIVGLKLTPWDASNTCEYITTGHEYNQEVVFDIPPNEADNKGFVYLTVKLLPSAHSATNFRLKDFVLY